MDPLPEWPFRIVGVLMVIGTIASLALTGVLIWGVVELVNWVITK